MKNVIFMNRRLVILPFVILAIAFSGCGSITGTFKRYNHLKERIPLLQLGMSKKDVLDILEYAPDYLNREAFQGREREMLIYTGRVYDNVDFTWNPMIYTLVFEDGKLVVINMDKDYEQMRIEETRRIEAERKEAEEKRTAAIVAAQKAAQQKENKDSKN